MDNLTEGLRCQDIHSGLRDLDQNSPLLGPLHETRLIGMAASLAGLIRGHDVISDGEALRTIAAQQLDVDEYAYTEIIRLLEDVEFVQGVQRNRRRILTFTESVPYYDDLYSVLGAAWHDAPLNETEQQLVPVIDGLSQAPVPLESLEDAFGLDRAVVPQILEIGKGSGLIRTLRTLDGDIAYSPFFAFENPALLETIAMEHGPDRFATELAAVRAHQGLEISPDQFPLLVDAVAAGLIMAPSVKKPNGGVASYAALPYAADQQLLRSRKPVLDKALAVLACLRSAARYAEHNTLTPGGLVNVIDKLLDRNRGFLNPNSAHRRQYELLRNAGIIQFAPDTLPGGSWVTPVFIDTADNREALLLARDLIVHGEGMSQRVDDATARQMLASGQQFTAPMQTMNRIRQTVMPSAKTFETIMSRAMGRSAL